MPVNPYRGLDDYRFWSRAVASIAPGQLDPMIGGTPIAPGERVVTMGSCFAQHLARNLAGLGLNYHIAEPPPPGMSEAEARRHNYGMFSARFGNIYTVRQAVQLYDRAFDRFTPEDDCWEIADGFVDAFRPQIEPQPYPTAEAVRAAARAHLGHVREMFRSADWLIFTLGLTEGWRSVFDGAVYPVAPGVAAGNFDPGKYEFINFSAEAVKRDLAKFIDQIHEANPGCRVILTVSPVPLIATYENRHVWASTAYSKAVLRVAADEVERAYPQVTYFPSYEIITSPTVGAGYFEDDLRSVADVGVKHVMRVFRKHFVAAPAARPAAPTPAQHIGTMFDGSGPQDVICDEDLIEKSVAANFSGPAGPPPTAPQPAPAPVAPQPPPRVPSPAAAAPTRATPARARPSWAGALAPDVDIETRPSDKPFKRPGLLQRLLGRG